MNITPKQWHIYVVNLEPKIGTKPGKQCPCLSIQPSEFGLSGLDSTVVIPLTTKVTREDAFPLRVRISKEICNLGKDSDLLIDQILAWDNSFFVKDLGPVPEFLVQDVKRALRDFLDL